MPSETYKKSSGTLFYGVICLLLTPVIPVSLQEEEPGVFQETQQRLLTSNAQTGSSFLYATEITKYQMIPMIYNLLVSN